LSVKATPTYQRLLGYCQWKFVRTHPNVNPSPNLYPNPNPNPMPGPDPNLNKSIN